MEKHKPAKVITIELDKVAENKIISYLKENEANFWNGSIADRKVAFTNLNGSLNKLFQKETCILFAVPNRLGKWKNSGQSYYNWIADIILLQGRLSVITYLHEYGHSLGMGEKSAQRFASDLFKEAFPKRFAKLSKSSDKVMFVK